MTHFHGFKTAALAVSVLERNEKDMSGQSILFPFLLSPSSLFCSKGFAV